MESESDQYLNEITTRIAELYKDTVVELDTFASIVADDLFDDFPDLVVARNTEALLGYARNYVGPHGDSQDASLIHVIPFWAPIDTEITITDEIDGDWETEDEDEMDDEDDMPASANLPPASTNLPLPSTNRPPESINLPPPAPSSKKITQNNFDIQSTLYKSTYNTRYRSI